MSEVEITRKGQWPILKYTIRGKRSGYAVVMIDDSYGDILINPGDQIALLHWWGKDGRGSEKLREFLVRDSRSYLQDKFSYGLSRWSWDEAMKDLREKCEEHWGHPDSWPEGAQEKIEHLDGIGSGSSDLFHYVLGECDVIMEAFGYDSGFGEMYGNRVVDHFLETKWPHLVEFWKRELAEEARNAEAAV